MVFTDLVGVMGCFPAFLFGGVKPPGGGGGGGGSFSPFFTDIVILVSTVIPLFAVVSVGCKLIEKSCGNVKMLSGKVMLFITRAFVSTLALVLLSIKAIAEADRQIFLPLLNSKQGRKG